MGSLRDLNRTKHVLTEDEYYAEMGRKYGTAGYLRHEVTHTIFFSKPVSIDHIEVEFKVLKSREKNGTKRLNSVLHNVPTEDEADQDQS